jgi:hypothetical protein
MSAANRNAKLAGSLATVALAASGGPLSIASASLKEAVKWAQERYLDEAPARELQGRVQFHIESWANGENISPEDIDLGLELAGITVVHFGPDIAAMAELNLDATQIILRVIGNARAADPYWGSEAHYSVAERAIGVTYQALIEQYSAKNPELLAVVQALRVQLTEFETARKSESQQSLSALGQLVQSSTGRASVSDVLAYLRRRILDWDSSIWSGSPESAIFAERRLRLTSGGPTITARAALEGSQQLVVLGNPGSGKTWLTRYYARVAAARAIAELEAGIPLAEVEIPILTTWDEWTKVSASLGPRHSLVAASFSSGLGHGNIYGGIAVDRLIRTHGLRDSKVLVIIDSLDEAADRVRQVGRFREMASIQGWRFVVTSRPAAWASTHTGGVGKDNEPVVVELKDLAYPDDVHGVINTWFAKDVERASALIKQLERHPVLRRSAVIPLFLAFYCLIAEEVGPDIQPLPTSRHALNWRVVRRLLKGRWSLNGSGPDLSPDFTYCEEVLARWAWGAVKDANSPSGLGNWGEDFRQPDRPKLEPTASRSLDNVAPKVFENDEGQITRRFVHRTILEHMLARYVASLEAEDAARILLPHLWFDPDWAVAAPAAIAAHNRHERGQLFNVLKEVLTERSTDEFRSHADKTLDMLLVAVAEETDPDEWLPEHAELIHAARIRACTDDASSIVTSLHWTSSNNLCRERILAALPRSDSWKAGRTAEVLVKLGAGREERDYARAGKVTPSLLLALAVTEDERKHARGALLNVLLSGNARTNFAELLRTLSELQPSLATRQIARKTVFSKFVQGELFFQGESVVSALAAICHTSAERSHLLAEVLNATKVDLQLNAVRMAALLHSLLDMNGDGDTARVAISNALSSAHTENLAWMAKELLALRPTPEERDGARSVLSAFLNKISHQNLGESVRVLVALEPTAEQRTLVCASLTSTVREGVSAHLLRNLLQPLILLDPAVEQKEIARNAIMKAMPKLLSPDDAELAMLLVELDPLPAQLEQVRRLVITGMHRALEWRLAEHASALVSLGSTRSERAQARRIVVGLLPSAYPGTVESGVEALRHLAVTEDELTEARTTVLDAISSAKNPRLHDLTRALMALNASPTELDYALTALVEDIALRPSCGEKLARTLGLLAVTAVQKRKVREAIIKALAKANPWDLSFLATEIAALHPTAADVEHVRRAITATFHSSSSPQIGALVGALRTIVSPEAWLSWLDDRPGE